MEKRNREAKSQPVIRGVQDVSTIREGTLSKADLLEAFQRHCHSLAGKGNAGYHKEFEQLQDVGKELSTNAGELDANKKKNRYPKIVPYDHCRVKLVQKNSLLHSDYINASYVPGGVSSRDFICTQGPLHNTVADFWRMLWEQNVHTVVMVTSCMENDKVLCDQYWPQEGSSVCYDQLRVTTLSCCRGPDCLISTISLYQMNIAMERRIKHYYYPSWPDRSVPQDPDSLCTFTEQIRQHLDNSPHSCPTVVHCSAGVGRSGTFVALLWLIQMCARGVQPDVRGVVHVLRNHRQMMVQTLEQYIFIHTCLQQWLAQEMMRHQSWYELSRRKTDRTCQHPRLHSVLQPRFILRPPTQRGHRHDHREPLRAQGARPLPTTAATHWMHPMNLIHRLQWIFSPP